MDYTIGYSDGWQDTPDGGVTAWATLAGPAVERLYTLTAWRNGSYSILMRDAADAGASDAVYAAGTGQPTIVHAMREAASVLASHIGNPLRALQP